MRDSLSVPNRPVLEAFQVEVRVQLAVQPRQQVQVEVRRHPGRIVVGRQQRGFVLDQVHAQQQAVAGLQSGAHAA